jgi:hypothetical protein
VQRPAPQLRPRSDQGDLEHAEPGNGDAIRLIGCRGDGNRGTVDLILDVNGNGRDRGTAYDAVRIGMNARDLVVTGDVECGRRHTNPNIHQNIV